MSASSAVHVGTVAPPRPGLAPPWRRLLADWAIVGASSLACHGLGAATALLLRMAMEPAQMGLWQGLKTLLGYANYTNLGASKAAARELAIAVGRGDDTAARRGLDLALTINTLSSGLYAAGLVAVALWLHLGGRWGGWPTGLAVLALLVVAGRYVTFHVTVLRSRQAFATASQLAVLEAALTLVLAGGGAWLWGLWGLYGGTLAVMLAAAVFCRRRAVDSLAFAWDLAEMRRLIAAGGPMLLAGVASSLLSSIDRLMVLAYLPDGAHQLGCYSLGLMVTAPLVGLGGMLATVAAPRYGQLLGRSGGRTEAAELVVAVGHVQAGVLSALAAAAILIGPPLVSRALADYRDGLTAMLLLVPGGVAAAMALPLQQYLVAVEGGRRVLAVTLAGLAAAAAANHLALSAGWGIAGVAAAMTLVNVAYLGALCAASVWRDLPRLRCARHAAALGGAVALLSLLAAVVAIAQAA